MTKYEEMKEAARTVQRHFSERQQHCWQYGVKLVQGFVSYCGIPDDSIRVLRWEGTVEAPFQDAEPGHHFTASGAMKFDEESESWRFGLRVTLTGSQWVFFGPQISDSDGKAVVRIGTDKARNIDPDDQEQWNALYDSIVEIIKGCYQEGIAKRRSIGFSIGG